VAAFEEGGEGWWEDTSEGEELVGAPLGGRGLRRELDDGGVGEAGAFAEAGGCWLSISIVARGEREDGLVRG
jgi:hypothetical protein